MNKTKAKLLHCNGFALLCDKISAAGTAETGEDFFALLKTATGATKAIAQPVAALFGYCIRAKNVI